MWQQPTTDRRRMHSERAFQDLDTRWMENTRTCRYTDRTGSKNCNGRHDTCMARHGMAWHGPSMA